MNCCRHKVGTPTNCSGRTHALERARSHRPHARPTSSAAREGRGREPLQTRRGAPWVGGGARHAIGVCTVVTKRWWRRNSMCRRICKILTKRQCQARFTHSRTRRASGSSDTRGMAGHAAWAMERRLLGHRGSVRCYAWSPNGKWLASSSADGRAYTRPLLSST